MGIINIPEDPKVAEPKVPPSLQPKTNKPRTKVALANHLFAKNISESVKGKCNNNVSPKKDTVNKNVAYC